MKHLIVLAAIVGAVFTSQAATEYRITSRWYQQDALFAAPDGQVKYGSVEDKTAVWIAEPAKNGTTIFRNAATGKQLSVDDKGLLTTKGSDPARWVIDRTADEWRSLQCVEDKGYLNMENRSGVADTNVKQKPGDKNWWSAQWKLTYISGEKPEPFLPIRTVFVTSPDTGGDVKGNTKIQLRAKGLEEVTARCWKAGAGHGADSVVATVKLDEKGNGSFVFPADDYPQGPITVRLQGTGDGYTNNCHLQLYNTSGKKWRQGLPPPPPQAAGMKMVYADDFDGALSISPNGKNAKYSSHKPGGGDFSGYAFSDYDSPKNPFTQRDTFLRIRADETKKSSGLLSSIGSDGTGFMTKLPCYFECRFIAQSAPGTWPAFWVMTQNVYKGLKTPADELDIIEAYGGEGPGNPNQRAGYHICQHRWNQGPNGEKLKGGLNQFVKMMETNGGSKASWFEDFHIYGCLITEQDVIYYCDNVEVARHATDKLTKEEPLFFFINFAIGGGSGWKIDLSQYNGIADMYVDYVRVFAK